MGPGKRTFSENFRHNSKVMACGVDPGESEDCVGEFEQFFYI